MGVALTNYVVIELHQLPDGLLEPAIGLRWLCLLIVHIDCFDVDLMDVVCIPIRVCVITNIAIASIFMPILILIVVVVVVLISDSV